MKIIKKNVLYIILGFLYFASVASFTYFALLSISIPSVLSYLNNVPSNLPKIYIVRSGSMGDKLPSGSLIAVKPQKDYDAGDVISFKSGYQVITHRIINVNDDGGTISYETKGDANNGPDRTNVAKENVIGRGFYALPFLGYFLALFKTREGFYLSIALPSFFIIGGELMNINNEVKKKIKLRKQNKLAKKHLKLSHILLLVLFIATFITGKSIANFSDAEGTSISLETGTWNTEWDKSSLYFDEESGCQASCTEIKARVCNGGDEAMQGPSSWDLYYVEKGNPKNGSLVASGVVDILANGECLDLVYNANLEGSYMYKAYQREGHPGTGELWSNECEVSSCTVEVLN